MSQNLARPGDRLQFPLESLQKPVAKLPFEIVTDSLAGVSPYAIHHRREMPPKAILKEIRKIDPDADLRKLFKQDLRAQQFAVDEHAIAIEDHQSYVRHRGIPSAATDRINAGANFTQS